MKKHQYNEHPTNSLWNKQHHRRQRCLWFWHWHDLNNGHIDVLNFADLHMLKLQLQTSIQPKKKTPPPRAPKLQELKWINPFFKLLVIWLRILCCTTNTLHTIYWYTWASHFCWTTNHAGQTLPGIVRPRSPVQAGGQVVSSIPSYSILWLWFKTGYQKNPALLVKKNKEDKTCGRPGRFFLNPFNGSVP